MDLSQISIQVHGQPTKGFVEEVEKLFLTTHSLRCIVPAEASR